MSMPHNCMNSNCPFECCDANGLCPSIRGDCVYFYDNSYAQLAPGVIVAIIIGTICLFTIIVMVVCFFCKKCKKRQLEPGSPRRISRGALPNMPQPRNQPSYGTDSFQDLIMAENRQITYPRPSTDPPSRDPSYFQNPNQININPYNGS